MKHRALFSMMALVLLGCPDRPDTPPSNDDTSKPADGGTDAGASCDDEQAKIEQLKAELAECRAANAPK